MSVPFAMVVGRGIRIAEVQSSGRSTAIDPAGLALAREVALTTRHRAG